MTLLGFASLPAVAIVCFLVAKIFKNFTQEEYHKHIPVLVASVGMIICVLMFMFIPGYVVAENIVEAAAIGIVSGLSATGIHQAIKQNTK